MLLEDYLQIKNPPYKEGIKLFATLGKNATLLALFNKGENSFNTKKLLSELQKIADARNSTKVFTKVLEEKIITEAPVPEKFTNFKENIPEVLQPIHDLALSSYKERALLHNKLCESALHELTEFDKERDYEGERKEIQDKMFVLLSTNENCWDKIFYFNEHGKLPTDPDEFIIENKTIRELCNLEKSIPTYITKIDNQLKKYEFDSEPYLHSVKNRTKFELRLKLIKKAIDGLPVFGKIREVKC